MFNLNPINIFNPEGDDRLENRRIWYGNPTHLIHLNDIKYKWAYKIYDTMLQNFWIPEKIDMSLDKGCFNDELTPYEQQSYKGILSYLTFLDSIQTNALPQLSAAFTAPELKLVLAQHTSQEGLHNKSYQVTIESVIEKDERDKVYYLWRDDPNIRSRCKVIAELYQDYLEDRSSPEKYFIALFADYLLESLYFFSGFYFFYNLNSRGLMPGTTDQIRYINRDEASHAALFQRIVMEAMLYFPHSIDQMYELTDRAVQQEWLLCNSLFQDNILGITSESTLNFLQTLANKRLLSIGLKPLYPNAQNPYAHLDRISSLEGKANFFEATVTTYQMSAALKSWDKI